MCPAPPSSLLPFLAASQPQVESYAKAEDNMIVATPLQSNIGNRVTSLVGASLDPNLLIKRVIALTLLDLWEHRTLKFSAGLAIVAALVWCYSHPMRASLVFVLLGGTWVAHGGSWRRSTALITRVYQVQFMNVAVIKVARNAIMILSAVPTLLGIMGLVSLFSAVQAAGSVALLLLMMTQTLVFTAVAFLSRKPPLERIYMKQRLTLSWHVSIVLGGLVAFFTGHPWPPASVGKAFFSVLFGGAAISAASVLQGGVAVELAVKRALRQTVQEAVRGVSGKLSIDTTLHLALCSWLIEIWNQPIVDVSWNDLKASLAESVEALRLEVLDVRVLPALDLVRRRLEELDVDKEARPMITQVRVSLAALSPPPNIAQAFIAFTSAPALSALCMLLFSLPFSPSPVNFYLRAACLLPLLLAAMEELLVLQALRSLRRQDGVETRGEYSGLAMVVAYKCPPLAVVWENVIKLEACLETGVTAIHVFQASSRAISLSKRVHTLAMAARGGSGAAAGLLAKESFALARAAAGDSQTNDSGSILLATYGDAVALVRSASILAESSGAMTHAQNAATSVSGFLGAAASSAAGTVGSLTSLVGSMRKSKTVVAIEGEEPLANEAPEVISDNATNLLLEDSAIPLHDTPENGSVSSDSTTLATATPAVVQSVETNGTGDAIIVPTTEASICNNVPTSTVEEEHITQEPREVLAIEGPLPLNNGGQETDSALLTLPLDSTPAVDRPPQQGNILNMAQGLVGGIGSAVGGATNAIGGGLGRMFFGNGSGDSKVANQPSSETSNVETDKAPVAVSGTESQSNVEETVEGTLTTSVEDLPLPVPLGEMPAESMSARELESAASHVEEIVSSPDPSNTDSLEKEGKNGNTVWAVMGGAALAIGFIASAATRHAKQPRQETVAER